MTTKWRRTDVKLTSLCRIDVCATSVLPHVPAGVVVLFLSFDYIIYNLLITILAVSNWLQLFVSGMKIVLVIPVLLLIVLGALQVDAFPMRELIAKQVINIFIYTAFFTTYTPESAPFARK